MYTKLLTYLNTRQYFTNRWHGEVFDNSIIVTDKELRSYNITRATLENMPQIKTVGLNRYNIVGVKDIDITLMKPHGRPLTELHSYMLRCVCDADLPSTVKATPYWNTFIKHRARFAELFFTVDVFASRVHTPISGMSKELRPFLTLQSETTVSFDVVQMQPTLLSNILRANIGDNKFSETIDKGIDIYLMLQGKANLNTRDEAKRLFFQMLFGKPSNELAHLFEGANFIQWINWYKGTLDPRNPHGKEKPHSNLAFLLQTYEVSVMTDIWLNLARKAVPFLTIHDEIIVRKSDQETAKTAIESVLNKHFKSYKLNLDKLDIKQVPQPEKATTPTPQQKRDLPSIGIELIGEQNHLSKQALIDRMVQLYQITDTRAQNGLKLLLDSNIIDLTHLETYYMKYSTPF